MSLSFYKGDIFGGLVAGIIALPLALAFGIASGLGASAGLYGAIILGFFASLFGGTKTQISGPTGPMSVVMASVVITLGDINAIMAVIFLAGVFQIIFGFLKIGQFVKYIPYPVISGFMSGIGIIIIILQINPFLGSEIAGSTIETIIKLPQTLMHINMESFILATLTLIIILFTPSKISKLIPSPLIALIIVTLFSIYMGFDVERISNIPNTLPNLHFPIFEFDKLQPIISFAFTLALLGAIDTLLTSLVADSITKTKHNSNKELIGQGIGNSLVSLVGGIPGAGATMRTVINVKSGGRTKLSGIIHSLFLLLLLVGLAPLAENIPLAILAGILMKVGIDILDYRLLKVIKSAPKQDLIVMISVFLLTVFVDLIVAVGAGIVMASLLITYRIAKEANVNISEVNGRKDKLEDGIRVIHINGAFFFGSTSQIIDKVDSMLDTKTLIFDCTQVPFMDVSAIFALEEMIIKLQDKKITPLLVIDENKKIKIEKLGIIKTLGNDRVFLTQQEALKYTKV